MESTREWSRCRQCGFKCRRVWDRRTKRVRDLGVSGRRTTLVWRRRRFECGNCGERHLEDHDQFQAGLTRGFAHRLVQDARVMSIRAASRHHGVGWHRIMGLVRAEAARVAERRRARPCRVLLVDETSIRRRHRYVTVVACGDSGKVLAMIPGRTKGSLSRFFRDQGAWWCRQVEIVVSDGSRSYQAAIAQYLPDARHVLDRFHVARWFTQGLTLVRRELQRRDPQLRPPTYEPDLFRARFTLLRRSDHLTDAHQKYLDRLFEAHGVSGIFERDGAIPRSLYETPVGLLVWAGPGGEPSRGLHEPSPVMSRWDSRCLRGTGRRLGSGWFPAVGSFGGSFSSGIPMSRSAVSCECCLC